jgi:hypothetical protein
MIKIGVRPTDLNAAFSVFEDSQRLVGAALGQIVKISVNLPQAALDGRAGLAHEPRHLILSDDDVLRLDRHLANRDTCQNREKKNEKLLSMFIGRLGPTAGAI